VKRQTIDSRDLSEIVVGSVVLAFPVAVTEEIWNLSGELSLLRTVLLLLASLVFIAFFVKTSYHHDFSFSSQKQVLARVFTVYGVTLIVVSAVLFLIGKLPLLADPLVAFKRVVIVSFAASFAATVVDSIGD